jgi:hypothetical protein
VRWQISSARTRFGRTLDNEANVERAEDEIYLLRPAIPAAEQQASAAHIDIAAL